MSSKDPQTLPLPSLLLELTRAIYPYKKRFRKTGKKLDYILTKDELDAIEVYLKTGSYEQSAEKMNTSVPMFYITIKNIISKLSIFKHLY